MGLKGRLGRDAVLGIRLGLGGLLSFRAGPSRCTVPGFVFGMTNWIRDVIEVREIRPKISSVCIDEFNVEFVAGQSKLPRPLVADK